MVTTINQRILGDPKSISTFFSLDKHFLTAYHHQPLKKMGNTWSQETTVPLIWHCFMMIASWPLYFIQFFNGKNNSFSSLNFTCLHNYIYFERFVCVFTLFAPLPPNSSPPIPTQLYVFFKHTKINFGYPNIIVSIVFHWRVVDWPGNVRLDKIYSCSPGT